MPLQASQSQVHEVLCNQCERRVRNEYTTTINNTLVCYDCLDSRFTRCDHCDTFTLNQHIITDRNHNNICATCDSAFFFECVECNNRFSNDSMHRDHENTCQRCARNFGNIINGYGYAPHCGYLFYHVDPETNSIQCSGNDPLSGALYVGLEIEYNFTRSSHRHTYINKIHREYRNHRITYFCRDGSLDGERGVEMIFHPHTPEAMIKRLRDGYSLPDPGTIDEEGQGAGIHISINRNFFSNRNKQHNYILLVNKLDDLFIQYARRHNPRWAAFDSSLRRDNVPREGNENHQICVNNGNSNRLETRIFLTTNKPELIERYVMLIKYAAEFANSERDGLFDGNKEALKTAFMNHLRVKNFFTHGVPYTQIDTRERERLAV